MTRAVVLAASLSLSLAASAAVAACKAPPAAGPATSNAAAPDGYLVWTQAEGGAQTTRWLAADGTELGHADGVLIAHAGGLWRLEAKRHEFPMKSCEEAERDWADEDSDGADGAAAAADAAPPAEGSSTGSSTLIALVGPDGKARIELGSPAGASPNGDGEMDDIGELEESASLQASVGRFLFVEEHGYSFSCGAHGNGAAAAHIVDLATGAPRALVTTAELSPAVRAAAHAALVAAASDEGSEEPAEIGAPELGETLPAWRDGKLAVRHLLWVDACYACSSGDWSSYTSATWVDGDDVPAALAAEPAVPAAIARMLAAAQGPAGVSWGIVDDAWRARFASTPGAAPAVTAPTAATR